MKSFRVVFILILISFLAIGCGSSGGGGEDTDNSSTEDNTTQGDNDGSTDEVITFPRIANPLTVEAKLNDANSNKASISPDGGTVELTLTDGTKAVLEIPESALLSSIEIKITEIESIKGLPFAAGFESAFYFEPEGLRLLKPAILKIFPPGGQAVQSTTGFSFHELGKEFHLYPLKSLSGSVQFELMHFSGYGTGNATDQEAADQRENHPPTSEEDQANQERGQNSSDEKYYYFLLAYWWNYVYPSIIEAEYNEFAIEKAYSAYLNWYFLIMGHGPSSVRFINEQFLAEQGLAKALTDAIQKSHERCVSETNINEIPRILRLYLWGQARPEIKKHLFLSKDNIDDLVKSCAKFELEFRSRIVKTQPSLQITTEIEAVVPIELSSVPDFPFDKSFEFTGDTFSKYLEADAVYDYNSDCTANLTGFGESFKVTRLEIDLNYYYSYSYPDQPSPSSATDVAIWIDPGTPKELIEVNCQYLTTFSEYLTEWSGGWTFFHSDELDQVRGGGYLIDSWDPGTITAFAETSYQRSSGGYQEDTILKLKHTPQ